MNTTEEDRMESALATQIKVELAERDMSQGDLAEAVGVGRPAMNRYLKGHQSMPMPTFYRVARALGISPAELMTRTADRASREGK